MLDQVLKYLTDVVFPTAFGEKNYKVVTNIARLLFCITLSLTSIKCIERLLNDEKLLENLKEMATKPESLGMFAGAFNDKQKRLNAIKECERTFLLWTDFTMMYQGDFIPLWDAYKRYKELKNKEKSSQKTHSDENAQHEFDSLRLIMHNLDKYFVDVPIVSV